jgi:hypothetical protein
MVFPLVIAGAALAASAFGAYTSYQGAKEQAAAQQAQIAAEQQAEKIRMQAMRLDARRRRLEVVRTQQRTRANALAMGTAQGSSQGSGLQGAYGAIAGQSGVNLLGINQNAQLGENMFDANKMLSAARMDYAKAGETVALGQGISSIGNTLLSNLGTMSNIAGNFGGGAVAASAGSSYGGWYNLSQTGGYPFPTPR